MKEEIILLEKILEKYEFLEPVPDDVKKRAGSSKKRVLKAIMKRAGIYSVFLSMATGLYFLAKKLGIGLTLAKCTLAVTVAGITAAAAVATTGTYIVVKEVIIKQDDSKEIKTPIDEHGQTEDKTIEKSEKASLYPTTLDGIKKKYGRVEEITLYNGRKLTGVVLKRGKVYSILTTKGIVKVKEIDIESKRRIR